MEPGYKEVNYFMSIDTADAILLTGDKELKCPLLQATEGSDAYDISTLLKETGRVTLDPCFVNTASCRSAITWRSPAVIASGLRCSIWSRMRWGGLTGGGVSSCP